MIGIFDSGSGGLTVLRAVRDRLPSADIVYFGDTKHAPYGVRPRAELSRLTVEGFRTLASQGATSIVSACNSVSGSLALALLDLSEISQDRLIEMVAPTVRALSTEDHGRILLVATEATVSSGLYEEAFGMLGTHIESLALPGLAGALEKGADEAELATHLEPLRAKSREGSFDTLVLACTHYPLVEDLFRKAIGTTPRIYNPAEAVALEVEARFWPREAGYGATRFLMSAESAPLRSRIAALFPESAEAVEVLE